MTERFEYVPNVTVKVKADGNVYETKSDEEGSFSLEVPHTDFSAEFSGENIRNKILQCIAR